MIRSYGKEYRCDFPNPDVVLQTLNYDDVAVIKEKVSESDYILTKQLSCWTQIGNLEEAVRKQNTSLTAENKKYNIEWYLASGEVATTSATLTDVKNGFIHFIYPNGGLFIIETKALRSMQCIET